MKEPDGFYAAYFASRGGEGIGMFVLSEGTLVGADSTGVTFDGRYSPAPDGGGYVGKVAVAAPPNLTLVQGVGTGATGLRYEIGFVLPSDFAEKPFIRLDTQFGPVHVRLVKVRSTP